MPLKGWIAVDFDGTLATFEGNGTLLGYPIAPMVNRVKTWLRNEQEVKIFTSRVSFKDVEKNAAIEHAIREWCLVHIGRKLEVTCTKDINCVQIWDDKAIRVIRNTGLSEHEYRAKRGKNAARR